MARQRSNGRRPVLAATASLIFVVVMYAAVFGGGVEKGVNEGAKRIGGVSLPGQLQPGEIPNAQNCPRMEPVLDEVTAKPIWIAGYPGSGFDLIAPMLAAFTGLTAVDIYRNHQCSTPIREDTPVPGACMSHWPLVQKDSPAAVAVRGEYYYRSAIFVIRNPAYAISSYHTRWWGAQRKIRGNHDQPPESHWIEWRDERLEHHLQVWKRTLTEWQRGVPAAGISGISMFVPYEQLKDEEKGPHVMAAMAEQYEKAQHVVSPHTTCLWHRVVDREMLNKQKVFIPSFTVEQKSLILSMVDELIVLYEVSEPDLYEILVGYRTEIQDNLRLDGDLRYM